MHVAQLRIEHFRNHLDTCLDFTPGITAFVGNNGAGKSNIVEALSVVSQLKSFRAAHPGDMVTYGAQQAVVRAAIDRHSHVTNVDLMIGVGGVIQVNKDRVRLSRPRDIVGLLPTVTFCPEDLMIVKGSPSLRRNYLDDVAVLSDPANDILLQQFDRILKQRNILLKQIATRHGGSGKSLAPDVAASLEVWNERYATVATRYAAQRDAIARQLQEVVAKKYSEISGSHESAGFAYDPDWVHEGIEHALSHIQADEFRRGMTLVGPHRDDVELTIDAANARTHASQGQQRSLALTLRLAAHALLTHVLKISPVLLLDDIFSELDPTRSRALIAALPSCQTVLTTAVEPPHTLVIERTYDVAHGHAARRV